MVLLKKLKKLQPRDFENLIYDLLVLRGLRNAHWRTPGADVGRDIEGTFDSHDFSGYITSDRWYVECKRYADTIDWPTVYSKLAYADVQTADYLLLCTTGSLSPQCKDQLAAHERLRRTPRIRAWEGATLDRILADEPILLSKYRLTADRRNQDLSALPFLRILAKAVHQVYGEEEKPTPSVELAAALAELSALYLSGPLSATTSMPHALDPDRDLYPWLSASGLSRLDAWDSYAVRALLTATRFVTRADRLSVEFFTVNKKIPCARIHPAPDSKSHVAREILNNLAVHANWEWSVQKGELLVTARLTD